MFRLLHQLWTTDYAFQVVFLLVKVLLRLSGPVYCRSRVNQFLHAMTRENLVWCWTVTSQLLYASVTIMSPYFFTWPRYLDLRRYRRTSFLSLTIKKLNKPYVVNSWDRGLVKGKYLALACPHSHLTTSYASKQAGSPPRQPAVRQSFYYKWGRHSITWEHIS